MDANTNTNANATTYDEDAVTKAYDNIMPLYNDVALKTDKAKVPTDDANELYVVHEHCIYTKAIDKYWHFRDRAKARLFYSQMVEFYKKSLEDKCEFEESQDSFVIKGQGTHLKFRTGYFYDNNEFSEM